MRKPLRGDIFKPRLSLNCTPRHHIDFCTEGSILTFRLVKNMMQALPKPACFISVPYEFLSESFVVSMKHL